MIGALTLVLALASRAHGQQLPETSLTMATAAHLSARFGPGPPVVRTLAIPGEFRPGDSNDAAVIPYPRVRRIADCPEKGGLPMSGIPPEKVGPVRSTGA